MYVVLETWGMFHNHQGRSLRWLWNFLLYNRTWFIYSETWNLGFIKIWYVCTMPAFVTTMLCFFITFKNRLALTWMINRTLLFLKVFVQTPFNNGHLYCAGTNLYVLVLCRRLTLHNVINFWCLSCKLINTNYKFLTFL